MKYSTSVTIHLSGRAQEKFWVKTGQFCSSDKVHDVEKYIYVEFNLFTCKTSSHPILIIHQTSNHPILIIHQTPILTPINNKMTMKMNLKPSKKQKTMMLMNKLLPYNRTPNKVILTNKLTYQL